MITGFVTLFLFPWASPPFLNPQNQKKLADLFVARREPRGTLVNKLALKESNNTNQKL